MRISFMGLDFWIMQFIHVCSSCSAVFRIMQLMRFVQFCSLCVLSGEGLRFGYSHDRIDHNCSFAILWGFMWSMRLYKKNSTWLHVCWASESLTDFIFEVQPRIKEMHKSTRNPKNRKSSKISSIFVSIRVRVWALNSTRYSNRLKLEKYNFRSFSSFNRNKHIYIV